MKKVLAMIGAAIALSMAGSLADSPARALELKIADSCHGTFPHFIAHLIAIAVLVAFPSIIVWLPSHMGS
jgi:hypothetical protein